MKFEDFLLEAIEKNSEIRLVPRIDQEQNKVVFYAHLNGNDGSTVDFTVLGNDLIPVGK